MSLLNRRWTIHKMDPSLSQEISSRFRISPVSAQVLINRGQKTDDQISEFLNPRLAALKDPFDIPGMREAVDRVIKAKENGEKVLVYGDYDVDGVTATSITVLALKKIGISSDYYIPHRYDEGYGLNKEAIKKISGQGVKLIITVDCGVSNFSEIDEAGKLGVDVIVTDHHNVQNGLPKAVAVVNPKRLEEPHSSRFLSGAGVAFKFVWALFRAMGISESSYIKEFLDLAAMGTVADVVPLVGENRTITVNGMKVLNEKKRVGVRQLIEKAGISGRLTTSNVSFMLAPRLNAPGRLEKAELSIRLILENDPRKAQELAEEVNKINTERQQIGNLIGEEAFAKLENADEKKLIVLSGKNWHPGVIGIVASKIAERFYRPAILISEEGGFCRGSARSIENFDIYSLLLSCRDLFSDFGGHKDAAGFEMPSENIPLLEERLNKEIEGILAVDNLVPSTTLDMVVNSDSINIDLARELEKLEPFGSGNPAPVLMCKSMKVSSLKRVGYDGNHLKMKLSDGRSLFDSIGFGMGSLADSINMSSQYDIAFNLFINEWDGFEIPQMELVDMRRVQ